MKKLFFLLCICSFSVLQAQKKDCCETKLNAKNLPNYSLDSLGAEYQRLKGLPEKCCSHYNSNFQLVMNECGYQIKKHRLSKRKIMKYMGKPDADSIPLEYRNYLKIKKEDIVWVYFWRNWHDFMYICITNGKAHKVDWFYAYE